MKTRKPAKKPIAPSPPPDSEEQDDRIIALAFRWSLVAIVVIAAGAWGGYYWYNRKPVEQLTAEAPAAIAGLRQSPKVEMPTVIFRDVTDEAGISFVHENGASGQKLLPETMGSGCAFFD